MQKLVQVSPELSGLSFHESTGGGEKCQSHLFFLKAEQEVGYGLKNHQI